MRNLTQTIGFEKEFDDVPSSILNFFQMGEILLTRGTLNFHEIIQEIILTDMNGLLNQNSKNLNSDFWDIVNSIFTLFEEFESAITENIQKMNTSNFKMIVEELFEYFIAFAKLNQSLITKYDSGGYTSKSDRDTATITISWPYLLFDIIFHLIRGATWVLWNTEWDKLLSKIHTHSRKIEITDSYLIQSIRKTFGDLIEMICFITDVETYAFFAIGLAFSPSHTKLYNNQPRFQSFRKKNLLLRIAKDSLLFFQEKFPSDLGNNNNTSVNIRSLNTRLNTWQARMHIRQRSGEEPLKPTKFGAISAIDYDRFYHNCQKFMNQFRSVLNPFQMSIFPNLPIDGSKIPKAYDRILKYNCPMDKTVSNYCEQSTLICNVILFQWIKVFTVIAPIEEMVLKSIQEIINCARNINDKGILGTINQIIPVLEILHEHTSPPKNNTAATFLPGSPSILFASQWNRFWNIESKETSPIYFSQDFPHDLIEQVSQTLASALIRDYESIPKLWYNKRSEIRQYLLCFFIKYLIDTVQYDNKMVMKYTKVILAIYRNPILHPIKDLIDNNFPNIRKTFDQ